MRLLLRTLALVALASPAYAADKDIVDTAVEAGKFKTLVAAVKAADLVDVLKGDGPFTVLAPTDEAFATSVDTRTVDDSFEASGVAMAVPHQAMCTESVTVRRTWR